MTIAIAVLVVFFLISLGCGVGIWFIIRRKLTAKELTQPATPEKALVFRWKYIMLPLATLLLTLILTAYFYRLLPAEIAYIFKLDGSPARWLSREMVTGWMLAPQFLLAMVAAGIALATTRLSAFFQPPQNAAIKPAGILLLIGNMVALPQIILFFAMLDTFSYNSYQVHLMPLWVFALIIMGLGAIALGIIFIQAMRRAEQTSK